MSDQIRSDQWVVYGRSGANSHSIQGRCSLSQGTSGGQFQIQYQPHIKVAIFIVRIVCSCDTVNRLIFNNIQFKKYFR